MLQPAWNKHFNGFLVIDKTSEKTLIYAETLYRAAFHARGLKGLPVLGLREIYDLPAGKCACLLSTISV